MRHYLTVLFFLLAACSVCGQSPSGDWGTIIKAPYYQSFPRQVDSLTYYAELGDVRAVYCLVALVADTSVYYSYMDHSMSHNTTVSRMAIKRLLDIAPVFKVISDLYPLDHQQLLAELQLVRDSLFFDSLTHEYYTPGYLRSRVKYSLWRVPVWVSDSLGKEWPSLPAPDLSAHDSALAPVLAFGGAAYLRLCSQRNPALLALVASENTYSSGPVNHLVALTRIFALPSKEGYTFDCNGSDMLSYWKLNWSRYSWDSSSAAFSNSKDTVQGYPVLDALFARLSGSSPLADSEFLVLAGHDPEMICVWALPSHYIGDNREVEARHRRLLQLSRIIAYCRAHGHSYKCRPGIQSLLTQLCNYGLSNADRRQVERQLLQEAQLRDVTAIECWFMAHDQGLERKDCLPEHYSVGRVLNLLYSDRIGEIVNDSAALALMLKKSALFSVLEYDNKVYRSLELKLLDCDDTTIGLMRRIYLATSDPHIRLAVSRIIQERYDHAHPVPSFVWESDKEPRKHKKVRSVWEDHHINNVMRMIEQKNKKHADCACLPWSALWMDYDQVGDALTYLLESQSPCFDNLNTLLQSVYGIPVDTIRTRAALQDFASVYFSMPEDDLYRYYLERSGYSFWDSCGIINYQQAYDLLKYDYVDLMSRNRCGISLAIISILSRHFNTTLGIHNQDLSIITRNGSFSNDKRLVWMEFLRDKGLAHDEKGTHSIFDWTIPGWELRFTDF